MNEKNVDDYPLNSREETLAVNSSMNCHLNSYNINENSSFYGSYSRGFRAPAYYEVNSSFYNGKSLYKTESNPSLKPDAFSTN